MGCTWPPEPPQPHRDPLRGYITVSFALIRWVGVGLIFGGAHPQNLYLFVFPKITFIFPESNLLLTLSESFRWHPHIEHWAAVRDAGRHAAIYNNPTYRCSSHR